MSDGTEIVPHESVVHGYRNPVPKLEMLFQIRTEANGPLRDEVHVQGSALLQYLCATGNDLLHVAEWLMTLTAISPVSGLPSCANQCNSPQDYATWRGERQEDSLMRNEPWVSLDAIARHLDVSKNTVYRWIDQREMPAHKVGRQWKFKISQVDEWGTGRECRSKKQA